MNQNQEWDEYAPEVKAVFKELQRKWDTMKATFPEMDYGKWVVLTSSGEVLVFSHQAEAVRYRIEHPEIITIQRCIGGDPVVIGPIEVSVRP